MPTIAHKEALKLQGFDMGPSRFPFRDLTRRGKGETEKGPGRSGHNQGSLSGRYI